MPEPAYLFTSLISSSIGFVMMVYGKKQGRPVQLGSGILLLVLPYFLHNPLLLTLLSAIVCVVVWLSVRAGL